MSIKYLKTMEQFQEAKQKAFSEYEEFNKIQKIESDFDKEMKKILKNEK